MSHHCVGAMASAPSEHAIEERAVQIVDLAGCSYETALMAARDCPHGDIEDAIDLVLGFMSCMHPRPAGVEDPTAKHGVHDLARPYAAAVGSWVLSDHLSSCEMLCDEGSDEAWRNHAAAERAPGMSALLLRDGERCSMVPRAASLPSHRIGGTPACSDGDTPAADSGFALLCCDFCVEAPEAAGSSQEALPSMLFVRLRPSELTATEEDLASATWAEYDSDAPNSHGRVRRRARLLLPLRYASTGECILTLEPPSNDHGFAPSVIPALSMRWGPAAPAAGHLDEPD